MSTVFVKKLNAQELGYRVGRARQAGSYFLIPKSTVNFFPSLSMFVLNDKSPIKVGGVTLDYTYHNSKHASSSKKETRDEYRIYVNNLGAHHAFQPGDIIVLEKIGSATYNLHHYNPANSKYQALQSLITRYRRSRATAALVPSSRITLP